MSSALSEPLTKLGPPFHPEDSASTSAKDLLALPLQHATPYTSSHHSTSTLSFLSHAPSMRSRSPFTGARPGPSPWVRAKEMVYNNRGMLLVLLSQFFGSLMSLSARVLETSFPEQNFHALQILFARQSITSVLVYVWMWKMKVEAAPFGPRGVRGLLIARGVGGFFGVFGLYYSLSYLDLSDATVITFLAPIVATFACSLIPALREPFTATNLFASLISLSGVVLIARPTAIFNFGHSGDDGWDEVIPPSPQRRSLPPAADITPHQRLIAVGVALIGVLGAASAFTTIRWIGRRAHPLVSVGYFSTWCTLVSGVGLVAMPSVGGVVWPSGWVQWGLLGGIGLSGFVMQFLLTAGLQREKAGRATNMVYAQMLFALAWERMVWGSTPGVLSIAGSGLILGSVIWVGVKKGETKVEVGDEEVVVPLVGGRRESEESEGVRRESVESVESMGESSSGRTSWGDWGEDEDEVEDEVRRELGVWGSERDVRRAD